MSLRIEQVFGSASIQAAPLFGKRGFGVPPGGCFDRESQNLANALIGNPIDAPCLELAMCKLVATAGATLSFSWVGAGASNGLHTLQAGESFCFESPSSGCRSYLALPGGAKCDASPIRSGSTVYGAHKITKPAARLFEPPTSISPRALRIVAGPQSELLSLKQLIEGEHEVSQNIDRIGVRLRSSRPQPHAVELASEPAIQGAVQIPPDGHPILFGPDSPTIGGYPKIAVVIRADCDRVAQLRPGVKVRFEQVSIDDARTIYRASMETLQRQVGLVSVLSGLN